MTNVSRWRELLWGRLDPLLLLGLFVLMIIGHVALFSAANQDPAKLEGQMLNATVALVCLWAMSRIQPKSFARAAVPLYVLGVLLLLGVALFGEISHGARRWLHIGVTRIQPSEIMKLAVPLMVAWYFDRFGEAHRGWAYIVAALLIVVPFAFIAKQPDLGTALLVGSAGFYVLFLAGLPWWVMALGLAAFLPVLYVVTHASLCVQLLHEYQCTRISILLDPSQDPLGAGYHTLQGSIAIGSGGVWGKGWLNGTQTHLDFIPERTTDFISAVYGEEFGLVGNLVLIMAYFFVILRGLWIARGASSTFGRLLAGSITLSFFTYAFVNLGMVAGILPVVGVPLPVVSYGGTALVTLMLGCGILMSIKTHKPMISL